MGKLCPKCSKNNPDDANYCYFDGEIFVSYLETLPEASLAEEISNDTGCCSPVSFEISNPRLPIEEPELSLSNIFIMSVLIMAFGFGVIGLSLLISFVPLYYTVQIIGMAIVYLGFLSTGCAVIEYLGKVFN